MICGTHRYYVHHCRRARRARTMRIALNGLTALKAWRSIRSGKAAGAVIGQRANLAKPDPSPARRWTPRCFDLGLLGLGDAPSKDRPLHVAVPEARLRIRTACVVTTTYTKLPEGAFVEVGGDIQLACPELVFLEMGLQMAPIVQLLLGYELCGTYSRDPQDPPQRRRSLRPRAPDHTRAHLCLCPGLRPHPWRRAVKRDARPCAPQRMVTHGSAGSSPIGARPRAPWLRPRPA